MKLELEHRVQPRKFCGTAWRLAFFVQFIPISHGHAVDLPYGFEFPNVTDHETEHAHIETVNSTCILLAIPRRLFGNILSL
jgi:hypothetical protein